MSTNPIATSGLGKQIPAFSPQNEPSRLSVIGYVETWFQEGFPHFPAGDKRCFDREDGSEAIVMVKLLLEPLVSYLLQSRLHQFDTGVDCDKDNKDFQSAKNHREHLNEQGRVSKIRICNTNG